MPEDIVCDHCGSEAVVFDAYVAWDADAQDWIVVNVFDECTCNSCGNRGTA